MDQSIEGPLRQIEAARLALHSPSLVGVRRPAPDPSMRGYAEMAAKPGRKCLSRTQMSEPYELSQDLLDKQLEMLSSRYGGTSVATSAANTIQRAYRRYSMAKKFEAITSAAQVKNENRLSRRFQGGAGGGVGTGQHTVRHVGRGRDALDGSGGHHHASCCVFNSGGAVQHSPGPALTESPASRHFTTPTSVGAGPGHGHAAVTQHGCHSQHCPARPAPWPALTPNNHIGVRPGLSLEEENHSDADIQSFPIDYLPDRSALTCTGRLAGAGQHRAATAGRPLGPSHAHCANCGSGQALPSHHSHRSSTKHAAGVRRAPDVPKRTVSRLTSLDVGESSELYPRPPEHSRVSQSAPHSRNSSTNSSPRVPAPAPAPAPALVSTSASSQSKPRTSQSSIPSRPKDVYHSNYAVNEVIRKRHYRTGLNIFNKKPERGVSYLIGKSLTPVHCIVGGEDRGKVSTCYNRDQSSSVRKRGHR